MYKKRKKPVTSTPQASSTLMDGNGILSSFTSSQSSVISSIDAKTVSDSPEDIFDSSPPRNRSSKLLLDISNKGLSSQPSISLRSEQKKTTNEVLEMLLSSQDSEPQRKIAKLAEKRPEERKLALSQELNSIANKHIKSILSKAGMVIGNDLSPNLLSM